MNILVVDDDLDLCTMLSRFLEKQGFVVHSAGDALQALDQLERVPVDFVVTDLMMPHMDGLSFLDVLKKDPRFSKIPVVLLTAYPSDDVNEKGLRKGAAFTLPKPVDFNRLLTLIRFAE